MNRLTHKTGGNIETKAWLIKDFPVELQKQIKIRAIEKGVRVKDIVIEAIHQYLKGK